MTPVKIICLTAIGFFGLLSTSRAQTTQSAIYDAATLLNAKHEIAALLLNKGAQYDIYDPIQRRYIARAVIETPDSLVNEQKSREIILDVLRRNAGLPAGATPAEILAPYEDNPFFHDIVPARNARDGNELSTKLPAIELPPGSGAAASNILSNLANGTADFLIERAGEEIAISVFERLQKFISHYPEFNTLFPRSVEVIKPVTPYEYTNSLNAFKAAIKEDVSFLPSRIPDLYQLPKYQLLNKKVPSLTLAFSSVTLVTEIHGKKSLSETMHFLGSQNYLAADNEYSTTIKLLSLISNSLRKKLISDPEEGDYQYISASDIDNLTRGTEKVLFKEELGRYYLGLLYQQCQSIFILHGNTRVSVSELLRPWATQLGSALDKIAGISGNLGNLNAQLAAIKDAENNLNSFTGKNITKAERYTIYVAMVAGVAALAEPFLLPNAGNKPYRDKLEGLVTYWKPYSGDIIKMVKAFGEQEYSLGVQDLIHLLQLVTTYVETNSKSEQARLNAEYANILLKRLSRIDSAVLAINAEVAAKQRLIQSDQAYKISTISEIEFLRKQLIPLLDSSAQLQWEQKNTQDVFQKITKVLTYVDLLISISQADNSQQVEAILESSALPAGSSRVKKVTNFNIAANAYVGGFGRPNSPSGYANKYGLTAPIGISFSHGFKEGGSLSLFTGAFDLGGIIKYKLDNQGAYQQDVSLAGLISPSIQVVYGAFSYLPLAVGVGTQWTTPASSTSSIQLSPHLNFFIGVDIPLFNLSVVKKK